MWLLIAAGVSHFSMVGFPVDVSDAQSAGADFTRYAQSCELHVLDQQSKLCVLKDKSGAELWIGLVQPGTGAAEIRTVNPALAGKGKTNIVVTADVSVRDWKPFERSVQAQFATGEAPLILDLADPRQAAKFVLGSKLEVDVTAFADEIALYDSEEAYYANQKDEKVKFASNHFIPSGMFSEGSGEKAYPTAHALFAGKILEAELRTNEVGKSRFWWVLVETFDGAIFNVVVDPSTLTTTPKPGGILSGSFWLSARLSGQ